MRTLPKTKPVEMAELTKAMHAAVPKLMSLVERATVLECHSRSTEFTDAELASLQGVYNAHDAATVIAERDAPRTERRQVLAQLRQLKQDWPTLTNAQKLDTLLVLMRYLILNDQLGRG